jgi:hypothetical protein
MHRPQSVCKTANALEAIWVDLVAINPRFGARIPAPEGAAAR